jgi:PAS domain S-box-containing protein
VPGNDAPMQTADRVGDPARLQALRETGLLAATSVPSLDRLTALAARLVEVPVALVALVDADRQVFVGSCGLDGRLARDRQTPLTSSFCRYVVADNAPLVVPDARADERLRGNPAIDEHDAIAYAGFPLRSPDGHVLGTFGVLDTRPRQWTDDQLTTLADLAAAAESEIAVRVAHGEMLLAGARWQAVLDCAQDAFVSMDTDGRVTAWNTAAERLFGWSAAEALGRTATALMIPPRLRAAHEQGLARVRSTGVSALAGQRLELAAVDRAGREFPIEMTLQVSFEHGQPVFHAFLHDISARTEAQAQLEGERRRLADERAFLQALLDSLDAGVVACDSDGHLALFNQALRDIHTAGQQPEDAESWRVTDALHAADGVRRLRPDEVPLARAFAGEVVRGEQVVVRVPGAAPRRFVANGRPIAADDGRRLGAVIALHDITEAHHTERLRRAQHAVAVALSDAQSARDAAAGSAAAIASALGWVCAEYWEVDAGGGHVSRVSSWTVPGRDPSAFTGGQSPTVDRGQGLAGLVWRTDAVVWSSRPARDPEAAERPPIADRPGPHTAIGLPVRSGDQVIGVLAFFADTELARDEDTLTMLDGVGAHLGRFVERRRAEDLTLALAAARRDFDRVVEQVNDYLWTIEILPGGAVRSVYASPNGSGVFGAVLPTDADMAAVMAQRMHPADRAEFARFHATVSAGDPAEIECRVVGFDDVTRWVWTRAVARHENGRLFVDGISTNITERQELSVRREQLLLQEKDQVRRLRELDRMKDELVAVVSHELRNPIAVIRGYTEALLDDPDLGPGPRRDLEVLDRTSGHLRHIVDDLLDLAGIGAGHAGIDPRPLSPSRLVRDSVQAHRPAADAGRLTLRADISRLRVVHGDGARLRQVLDNLLSNAIKYTPGGGTVTVTAADTADGVQITVADTGIGIPAEQYPQLFTRFFRASTATSRGIKGTGLGLAVTKAIVEAHGGAIDARPAPGGGTRFTVTLPAQGRSH